MAQKPKFTQALEKELTEQIIKAGTIHIPANITAKLTPSGTVRVELPNGLAGEATGKIAKRLKEVLSTGPVGNIRMDTIIPKAYGITWAIQLGRYFEWAVYIELLNISKKRLGADRVYAEMKMPSLSFIGQSNLNTIKHPELIRFKHDADESAKLAASLLAADLGDNIVEAVAAGNSQGDLRIQNLMIELKYYADTNRITWYSFNDTMLGFSLRETTKQDGLWFKVPPNNAEKPLNMKDWTEKIRQDGIQKFMERAIERRGGGADDMFMYLLNKGETNVDSNKKLLTGVRLTKKDQRNYHVELSLSLNALNNLNAAEKMYTEMRRLQYTFIAKQVAMADVSASERQIRQYAKPIIKVENNKSVDWDEQTAATQLQFSLQRGYYGPGSIGLED